MIRTALALTALILVSGEALAQEQGEPAGSDADLAKQLANPVAHLISLPFQLNYDCCLGPDNDAAYLLNVQPVIPFAINNDMSLIVRTIVPFHYREGRSSIPAEGFGFGDTTQSFFFTPRAKNGFTWGVGPAVLWPTGSQGYQSGKWGVGPTGIALKQEGPYTYGVLANHIWSFAGAESRSDVSTTFIQPFFNYTWPDSTSFILNMESSYDWEGEQATIPLNVGVSHIYNFSGQRVSLAAFGRGYFDRPDGGPDWGLRFVATFLFPTK
jgi:hypothetical protein